MLDSSYLTMTKTSESSKSIIIWLEKFWRSETT